jgi:hypothetical protein
MREKEPIYADAELELGPEILARDDALEGQLDSEQIGFRWVGMVMDSVTHGAFLDEEGDPGKKEMIEQGGRAGGIAHQQAALTSLDVTENADKAALRRSPGTLQNRKICKLGELGSVWIAPAKHLGLLAQNFRRICRRGARGGISVAHECRLREFLLFPMLVLPSPSFW